MRRAGIAVDLALKGKPGQRMKQADRIGAKWAVSLGNDELAQGVVRLRDLDSGVQEELGLDALAASSSPEMGSAFDEKLSQILARRDELQALLAEVQPSEYAKLAKEFSDLGPVVETIEAYRDARRELGELELLVQDPEMRDLADQERREVAGRLPDLERQVRLLLLPRMLTTRVPSSRSAPALVAMRLPCSPATYSACTSAMPTSRVGAASCCRW